MATGKDLVRLVRKWRALLVVGVLGLTVLLTPPVAERYGDRLQVALPLLGLGCAALTGGVVEYTTRFVILEGGVHGTKAAMSQHPWNKRPNGGYSGFPSGHTAAASFGASALVHECISGSPLAKAVVVVAAGFVGASRIDAGAHTIWQVLAGVLYGYATERLLRKHGPLRRGVFAGFSKMGASVRRRFRR